MCEEKLSFMLETGSALFSHCFYIVRPDKSEAVTVFPTYVYIMSAIYFLFLLNLPMDELQTAGRCPFLHC